MRCPVRSVLTETAWTYVTMMSCPIRSFLCDTSVDGRGILGPNKNALSGTSVENGINKQSGPKAVNGRYTYNKRHNNKDPIAYRNRHTACE